MTCYPPKSLQQFLATVKFNPVPEQWKHNSPQEGLLFRATCTHNPYLTAYAGDQTCLHATPVWEEAETYFETKGRAGQLFYTMVNGETYQTIGFLSVFKAYDQQEIFFERMAQAGEGSGDLISTIEGKFIHPHHHEALIDGRNQLLSIHVLCFETVKKFKFFKNSEVRLSQALSVPQLNMLSELMSFVPTARGNSFKVLGLEKTLELYHARQALRYQQYPVGCPTL